MFKRIYLWLNNKSILHIFNIIIIFIVFLVFFSTFAIFTSLNLFRSKAITSSDNSRYVSIELDGNYNSNDFDESDYPKKFDYEKLSKSNEVEFSNISANNTFFSSNVIDISDVDDSNYGYFTFKGLSDTSISDFDIININVIEGRTLNDSELNNTSSSIMISNQVAQKNNLKVGDTFYMKFFNYKNKDVTYEKEMSIVGIFSPIESLKTLEQNFQNINNFIKQEFPEKEIINIEDSHSSKHESDLNTKTEFGNILELKTMFFYNDINSIYMSNVAIEKLSNEIANKFNYDTTNIDYRAVYLLKKNGSLTDFRIDVKNILSDHFTAYGVNDAFDSWVPHTVQNTLITGLTSGLLLILLFASVIWLYRINFNRREYYFYQHILIGKSLVHPFKLLFKTNILYIALLLISSSFFGLKIAKLIILKYFTFVSSGGIYYNIQNYYRNLIDTTDPLVTYVQVDLSYLISILLIFALSILIISFLQNWTKKKYSERMLV